MNGVAGTADHETWPYRTALAKAYMQRKMLVFILSNDIDVKAPGETAAAHLGRKGVMWW